MGDSTGEATQRLAPGRAGRDGTETRSEEPGLPRAFRRSRRRVYSSRETGQPRVVVVGGGFGGLKVAEELRRAPVRVTLVDRANYHTFLPLLYQVGAAELDAESIAYPLRGILRGHRGADFVMAEVRGADLEQRLLKTDGPDIPYDYLVLAAGSVSHYFGVPGAEDYALALKSLEQGAVLRSHILDRFEWACCQRDPEARKQALTFTIVGGGPTGVEYIGALAELVYGPLTRDYPELDFGEVRLVLIEGTNCVLGGFPPELSAYALKRLQEMGIEVRLNTVVDRVTPTAVHFKDGSYLATETVVWTAGVRGHPVGQALGLPTARNGRVLVEPTLQVAGHPEVQVIGDLAQTEGTGPSLPMIAPVAVQQGTHAARNILRLVRGEPPRPFTYKDPGTMVTIGRNKAVARLAGRSFTGFVAWVIWLTVHLMKLVGFKNRVLVLMDWAWDYLLFERTQRIILGLRRPEEPFDVPTKTKTSLETGA